MPIIIDLNAEAAKLTMFRGETAQTTRAERKGSTAQLPRYRDGLLLLAKSAGTSHWETHPEDETARRRWKCPASMGPNPPRSTPE